MKMCSQTINIKRKLIMAWCEKRDMKVAMTVKGRGRLMISRIGCRIILSIGCVLGNVASNWVREGEGGGVLPSASETRVYTLSTEMLSSQWNFKTLQALTSPTGLGENVSKAGQKWVENRNGRTVIGTVGIVETLVVSHESHCTIIDILRIWMFDSLANKITAVILWLDIAANFRFLHSTVRVHSDGGADHYSGPLIFILETFIVSSW